MLIVPNILHILHSMVSLTIDNRLGHSALRVVRVTLLISQPCGELRLKADVETCHHLSPSSRSAPTLYTLF